MKKIFLIFVTVVLSSLAFAEEVKKYNENGNQYYKRKGNEYWTCSEPLEMVVLTDDGLPLYYRKSPVEGEKLGDFKNEVLVYATKRTAEKYEADGITDYWYLVHLGSEPEKQGWVFGGSIEFNGEWPTPRPPCSDRAKCGTMGKHTEDTEWKLNT